MNKTRGSHCDDSGSVVALSDANGAIVERYEYDVFGEVTILSPSHEPRTTSDYANPYYFTGRRYDDESGLYYYRARYYSPEIGRFLQTDPIGYDYAMNLYEYCFNNAANWVDPYGLAPQWWHDFVDWFLIWLPYILPSPIGEAIGACEAAPSITIIIRERQKLNEEARKHWDGGDLYGSEGRGQRLRR